MAGPPTTALHVIPTKWRSFCDHRFSDVTSLCVYVQGTCRTLCYCKESAMHLGASLGPYLGPYLGSHPDSDILRVVEITIKIQTAVISCPLNITYKPC